MPKSTRKRMPKPTKGSELAQVKAADLKLEDVPAPPRPGPGEIDLDGGSVVLQALRRDEKKAAREWEKTLAALAKQNPRMLVSEMDSFAQASGKLHVVRDRLKLWGHSTMRDLLRAVEGQVEALIEERHRTADRAKEREIEQLLGKLERFARKAPAKAQAGG